MCTSFFVSQLQIYLSLQSFVILKWALKLFLLCQLVKNAKLCQQRGLRPYIRQGHSSRQALGLWIWVLYYYHYSVKMSSSYTPRPHFPHFQWLHSSAMAHSLWQVSFFTVRLYAPDFSAFRNVPLLILGSFYVLFPSSQREQIVLLLFCECAYYF